jgi:flagellar hook-basal body complex protein FliE
MATTNFAAGAYSTAKSLIPPTNRTAAVNPTGAGATPGGSFGTMLQDALESVGESGRKAETQAMNVAGGKADVVDVVTAVAESETALQTLVAVRDRVISAYEEIMRMPI